MIIESLKNYYEILLEDKTVDIPVYGYSRTGIGYALILSLEGDLLDIISLKIESKGKKKKMISRTLVIPFSANKSSNIAPSFMSGNTTYMLGFNDKGKPERALKCFHAFKELHTTILKNATGITAKAILAFLNKWDPEQAESNPILQPYINDLMKSNLVFQIDGSTEYAHESAEMKRLWIQYKQNSSSDVKGQCLVTGEYVPIARIHTKIKGIRNTDATGCSLISCNEPAFESFEKTQSYNSPVSEYAEFAYTTVLNYMTESHKQVIDSGDNTTLFWAESPENMYIDLAAQLFNPSISKTVAPNENAVVETIRDHHVELLVKNVLLNAKSGLKSNDLSDKTNDQTKFYILGTSGAKGRGGIRFFHKDTFGGFVSKTMQHYQDLHIEREFDNQPENIPTWLMINETISPKSTNKKVSPLIDGEIMRSIVNGTPYPMSLYNAIITRVKTDIDDKDKKIQRINYVRASIIKACLLRKARHEKDIKLQEVLTVSLNDKTSNVEYLLGRLFALLERAQVSANKNIKRTIKDSYFGSACSTPAAVFPILLKLSNHHLSKAQYGSFIEKDIASILEKIEVIPSYLTLQQQGVFILGYYHQKIARYQSMDVTKKEAV